MDAVISRMGLLLSGLALFDESSRHSALEGHLAKAGFHDVEASWFRWSTEYPDFDTWWDFAAGFGPLQPFYAALDQQRTREAKAEQISPYRTPSGSYRLPATARLLTAQA